MIWADDELDWGVGCVVVVVDCFLFSIMVAIFLYIIYIYITMLEAENSRGEYEEDLIVYLP